MLLGLAAHDEAPPFWDERTKEAFESLRAYFKNISVYMDIGINGPARGPA